MKNFTLFMRDVQGDSFAMLTAASMHNNHLIIPLLCVIRSLLLLKLVPTQSGGMGD